MAFLKRKFSLAAELRYVTLGGHLTIVPPSSTSAKLARLEERKKLEQRVGFVRATSTVVAVCLSLQNKKSRKRRETKSEERKKIK